MHNYASPSKVIGPSSKQYVSYRDSLAHAAIRSQKLRYPLSAISRRLFTHETGRVYLVKSFGERSVIWVPELFHTKLMLDPTIDIQEYLGEYVCSMHFPVLIYTNHWRVLI